MDEHVYELLRNTYCCSVVKVGLHKNEIEVERKKRIGVKGRFLWIFPIYEYERWTDILYNWEYRSLRLRNNFTGKIVGGNVEIAVCYDSIGNKCYWRYV